MVDEAYLETGEVFAEVEETELESVGVSRKGNKGNLKAAEFTADDANATDMDAIDIS